MNKHDLCCIGHITLDKVVTPQRTVFMPGGTAFYFSKAISKLAPIDYKLVTAVGESEMHVVHSLRDNGINVSVMPSRYSVCFENIYGENQDNREQRVSAKADPFRAEDLQNIDARIFHLGSLLADDFSQEVLHYLSSKGRISVDVQGYLREVRDEQVYPVDWNWKLDAFPHIHYLKLNELEMEVLTGHTEVKKAACQLYEWGIREVLITLGSLGSVIFDGDVFYSIPAYRPTAVIDATGCGDTYMTGYLYKRAQGCSIEEAGRFAAAMSTKKIERNGPFEGTPEDILYCMTHSPAVYPDMV